MRVRASVRLIGVLVASTAASCVATTQQAPGSPVDGPLPAGQYDLTAHVSYRNDTDRVRRSTYATYGARLYVTWDGATRLWEGKMPCTAWADLPDRAKVGRRDPGPGHYFVCASGTWSFWSQDGKLMGRMSARVTEMVMSRVKCLSWTHSGGRANCDEYGVTVDPHTTTVSAPVGVEKVGG